MLEDTAGAAVDAAAGVVTTGLDVALGKVQKLEAMKKKETDPAFNFELSPISAIIDPCTMVCGFNQS